MAAPDQRALFSGPEPEDGGGGEKADMLLRGREGTDMRIAASILLAAAFLVARPALPHDALDFEYEQTITRLEKEAAAIPPEENAATCYRKAFLALPKREDGGRLIIHPPKTDEEKVEYFISGVLCRAPPDAINEMPGAKEEIRKYEEAVTVHLRRAAAMKRCSFDLDWRAGAGMSMPHLAKMRDLARKAVCYGKLLEIEKKPREAARVYLDVIRMGCHLDQDPALISLLVGIACVGISAPAIEGLLARGVDAETAGLLLDGLRALPGRPFNGARAVDVERVFFSGWARREFIKLADHGREKLLQGLLPRWDDDAEHEPWKIPDSPEERRRLLDDAFEVYDAQMKQLVRAMYGLYHKTRHTVESLERAQKTYWKGEVRKGRFAAAMVDMMAGATSALHARTARAKACLSGLKLLAAACLAKAERGEYPDSLAALKKYFPRGVPRDPFTGGCFSYWLAGGLPVAACEGDDPEVKKKLPATYHFGLSYRLRLEKWEVEKWRAELGETGRGKEAAE